MKIYLFIIFFILSLPLHAINIDSLRQVTQKSNSAQAWNTLSVAYYISKDTVHQRQAARKALQIAEQENNPDEIANAYINLALPHKFYNWNKYEEIHKKAFGYAKEAGNINLQILALNNLGDCCNAKGHYEDAVKYFKTSLQLYDGDAQYITYTNIGSAYMHKGQLDSATHYAVKSLAIAIERKDSVIMYENNTKLAIIESRKNQYATGLEYYKENLHLAELSKNHNIYVLACNNIATQYSNAEKNDVALSFARKGMDMVHKYREKINRDIIGNTLFVLGNELRIHGRVSEAIDTLRQSLAFNEYEPYYMVASFLKISSCFYTLNKFDSCEVYLDKAKEILDNNKELPYDDYYLSKGRLYVKQKKYKEAIPFLLKSEELANEADRSYVKTNRALYDDLSLAYEKGSANYEKALHYKKLSSSLQDSVHKRENNEMMADFATRYRTAEKELEISRLNEKEQQMIFQRWLMIISSILIVILLLAILLYNRTLRLRKAKEAAELTNRIQERDAEYDALFKETELKQMRHYLDGLEAESNRIAKELHDNIANNIYLLDQELSSRNNIPPPVLQQVENLYNQVRNISHRLISPVFQYISLPEMLSNYIEELKARTKIHFNLQIENNDIFDSLPTSISHEIYRIVQECSGNSIKYSSAQHGLISLNYTDKKIILTVQDDGIGFDYQKKNKGIGLHIIKDRCKSLGGSMSITTAKDKGCHIQVIVPFIPPIVDEWQ